MRPNRKTDGCRMPDKPSEVCTYKPGDLVCCRGDCPKCCVRNFRDQATSDLPASPRPTGSSRQARVRRHREPGLLRLIHRLKGR